MGSVYLCKLMPVWVPYQYDSMVSYCFNLHIRTLWFSSWTTSSGAHMTPSGLDDENFVTVYLETDLILKQAIACPLISQCEFSNWSENLDLVQRTVPICTGMTCSGMTFHVGIMFTQRNIEPQDQWASMSLWVTLVSCEQLLTNLVPLWSDGCFGWCTWVKFSGKQLLLIWDIHVRKTRIRCKLTK